jgi:hypothetical protein
VADLLVHRPLRRVPVETAKLTAGREREGAAEWSVDARYLGRLAKRQRGRESHVIMAGHAKPVVWLLGGPDDDEPQCRVLIMPVRLRDGMHKDWGES